MPGKQPQRKYNWKLCRNISKARSETLESAKKLAEKVKVKYGVKLEIYDTCPCGYYHLSRRNTRNRKLSERSPEYRSRTYRRKAFNKRMRPQIEAWENEGGAIR